MKRIALVFVVCVVSFGIGWSAEEVAPVKGLEDCVKIGLKHYRPLKLADEELELARVKKEEAYRRRVIFLVDM